MLTPSTPAAPRLALTFCQASVRVLGAYTLSVRLNQIPPLTPLTSADTIRSVQIAASTQLKSGRSCPWASAPCLAASGTSAFFLAALHPSRIHVPASLSLEAVLLPAPSRLSPQRYHEGSDFSPPAHTRRTRRLFCLASSISNLKPCCMPAHRFHESPQRVRLFPAFAMNCQACCTTPPKPVRYPTGCPFASIALHPHRRGGVTFIFTGCDRLRRGFHPADQVSSQMQLIPAKAGAHACR